MDRIWIVAANASRARVYERDPDTAELVEKNVFIHPQSRQKIGELMSDRAGHVEHGFGTAGRGSAQYEPPQDAHEREREKFARELARFMEDACHGHRCPGWMLFASNPFIGELKAQLGVAATRSLMAAEPSDLTAWSARDLSRRVIEVIEAKL